MTLGAVRRGKGACVACAAAVWQRRLWLERGAAGAPGALASLPALVPSRGFRPPFPFAFSLLRNLGFVPGLLRSPQGDGWGGGEEGNRRRALVLVSPLLAGSGWASVSGGGGPPCGKVRGAPNGAGRGAAERARRAVLGRGSGWPWEVCVGRNSEIGTTLCREASPPPISLARSTSF